MRRRILLADDSVTIQKVIELTFLDEDYEVKAVSNGDEAIAALPQVNPDFVIADVHMPGANGYEVCRRSKELRPNIPVLLLVGTFEPFDEGQSRAVGADSFLKKPFDSQELLQRVEELLAARPAPAPEADLLGMPSLSELPPLDLEPAPAGPAAPEVYAAPAPEWGSFQVEPAPVPVPDPFPAPTFRLEDDRPAFALEDEQPFSLNQVRLEDDRPFAPSGESSFDESPFRLDEEPLPASAPAVDESALLPAGEPLFELDSAPSYETPSFEEPYPSFETPSYDPAPAFEPLETPPPFEDFPAETPFTRAETVSIETETFEVPGFAPSPEERLGVPHDAAPLVESLAETEARIEAPPPPSFEASHEPSSTAAFVPAPMATEVPVAEVPASNVPAASNGAGRLSDEDVDRIARRVVELMADRTIRDVAWEVIPDMAEMVIRDRLRELESQAESFE